MPRTRSNSPTPQKQPSGDAADAIRKARELFDPLRPQIGAIVQQVCVKLNHHPQPMELEDYAEELDLLLRENDFARLRSFRHESAPETWLFTIAKRHIGKQLRQQRKQVELDDLLLNSLRSEPNQEKEVTVEEIARIALDGHSNLTPQQKEVFALFLAGWSDQEISEALDIKRAIVWNRKFRAFKKIRERLEINEKEK